MTKNSKSLVKSFWSIVRDDVYIKRKFIIKVNKFFFSPLLTNDRFLKLMRLLIWRIISGKNSVLCQFVALWTHRKRTINSFLSYVVKYTHILSSSSLLTQLFTLKFSLPKIKILLHCLEFFDFFHLYSQILLDTYL